MELDEYLEKSRQGIMETNKLALRLGWISFPQFIETMSDAQLAEIGLQRIPKSPVCMACKEPCVSWWSHIVSNGVALPGHLCNQCMAKRMKPPEPVNRDGTSESVQTPPIGFTPRPQSPAQAEPHSSKSPSDSDQVSSPDST